MYTCQTFTGIYSNPFPKVGMLTGKTLPFFRLFFCQVFRCTTKLNNIVRNSYLFFIIFQAKAIALAAKNGKFKHVDTIIYSAVFNFVSNTKTKVIALANHNTRGQSNEPIRAQSKYMQPAPSAGKCARVSHGF